MKVLHFKAAILLSLYHTGQGRLCIQTNFTATSEALVNENKSSSRDVEEEHPTQEKELNHKFATKATKDWIEYEDPPSLRKLKSSSSSNSAVVYGSTPLVVAKDATVSDSPTTFHAMAGGALTKYSSPTLLVAPTNEMGSDLSSTIGAMTHDAATESASTSVLTTLVAATDQISTDMPSTSEEQTVTVTTSSDSTNSPNTLITATNEIISYIPATIETTIDAATPDSDSTSNPTTLIVMTNDISTDSSSTFEAMTRSATTDYASTFSPTKMTEATSERNTDIPSTLEGQTMVGTASTSSPSTWITPTDETITPIPSTMEATKDAATTYSANSLSPSTFSAATKGIITSIPSTKEGKTFAVTTSSPSTSNPTTLMETRNEISTANPSTLVSTDFTSTSNLTTSFLATEEISTSYPSTSDASTFPPTAANLTSFKPLVGWDGTNFTVIGDHMFPAYIYIGPEELGLVLDDNNFTFKIHESIPLGRHSVTLRDSLGSILATALDEVEIYPKPQWQYDNGLGFPNTAKNDLSYPFVHNHGNYHDTFGFQVYIAAQICVGTPFWNYGWHCTGYWIVVNVPRPIALAFYLGRFRDTAEGGECFGMSMLSLLFYHDIMKPEDYQSGALTPADITTIPTHPNGLRRWLDMRQGSWWAVAIFTLWIKNENKGVQPVLGIIRSHNSSDMGVLGVRCSYYSNETQQNHTYYHAMVPTYYHEYDADTIRLFVYDSNMEEYSNPITANEEAQLNKHPPYITINSTDWRWTYGTCAVPQDRNLYYVNFNVGNGPRQHPSTISHLLWLLFPFRPATMQAEDSRGRRIGVLEDGSIRNEIDGAVPLPFFISSSDKKEFNEDQNGKLWMIPSNVSDTYTINLASINGTNSQETYEFFMINNKTCMISLRSHMVEKDTLRVNFGGEDSYTASIDLATADSVPKSYTLNITNEFEQDAEDITNILNETHFNLRPIIPRTFSVESELTNTGGHSVKTNSDKTGILFMNHGTTTAFVSVLFVAGGGMESNEGNAEALSSVQSNGIEVSAAGGFEASVPAQEWFQMSSTTVINIARYAIPVAPDDCDLAENLCKKIRILSGRKMRKEYFGGRRCVSRCILESLVNFKKRRGWECGECSQDEKGGE